MATETKDKFAFIHGCYTLNKSNETGDAVVVKRYRIKEDGTRIPEVRIHENPTRPVWITKPAYRKHVGKLEYEHLSRLDRYETTQRSLVSTIQKKLKIRPSTIGKFNTLSHLCNSPYVYGVDLDMTQVIGNKYRQMFEVDAFDLAVGCMDTETNVVDGSDNIIIMTYYFNKTAYLGVDQNWLTDKRLTADDIRDFIIGELDEVKELGIDVKVIMRPTPAEVVIAIMNEAHRDKPDIIGFWNISFDIPKIIQCLENEGHDPADIFSDPSVPRHLRHFQWKEGSKVKVTDSGKFKPLAPSEQWHTVHAPASFYFIDPSSVYRIFRRQKSEPSYSLDYITGKVVGKGKYKPDLPDVKGIPAGGLRWHRIMQSKYQLHYCAYAIIDVIQPVRMDEKIGDLSKKLPQLSIGSHWQSFNSNPRTLADQLHTYFLKKGYVIGTTGSEMENPIDKEIPESKDWIVTLEAALMEDTGLWVINVDNHTDVRMRGKTKGFRRSKLFIHNADLDIVSTYPTLGIVFNIARETTKFETCRIEGVGYYKYREIGINLTGGKANGYILGKELFGLKEYEDVLTQFELDHGLTA